MNLKSFAKASRQMLNRNASKILAGFAIGAGVMAVGFAIEASIVFAYETDAIDTLVNLKDIIKAYGRVTVKDLMDLVGVAPNPDDDRLGWLNVDDATINLIEQDKEHPYCLMLPHPVSFNG